MLPIARAGLNVILARDLTDAQTEYNPAKPYTPDDGTAEVVREIEKQFAPTVDFLAEMRKVGLAGGDVLSDPVRITPWGTRRRPQQLEAPVLVTLSFPPMAKAEIRFTLDGNEPKASSLLYSKPLNVADTTELRAAAFLDGKQLVDPHVHEEKVGPLGGRQYGEIAPVGWLPNNTLYRLDHPDVLS